MHEEEHKKQLADDFSWYIREIGTPYTCTAIDEEKRNKWNESEVLWKKDFILYKNVS